MNQTYFANKKSLQIISQNIKNDIKTEIDRIGSFNLTSKYYTFLNKKNVNNLKESDFLVSLSTFGKKFILFITTYNTKKYCIFINKKNDTMTITQLKFSNKIFNGTLFEGELVKNNYGKWIFLINDIAYYKGNNIITLSFHERSKIIKNILENEYFNEDNIEDQTFFISFKQYFEYKYIKEIIEVYMKEINYNSSGLFFKSINNFSDNYLFIFPECRSDSKILNNGFTIDNQKISIPQSFNKDLLKYSSKDKSNDSIKDTIKNTSKDLLKDTSKDLLKDTSKDLIKDSNITYEKDDEESLFQDIDFITDDSNNDSHDEKTTSIIINKTCKFLINSTPMPDIYELYCKNSSNHIEKYSYASVPDIKTSDFLKIIMINDENIDINSKIKNNKAIYVECNYHKNFKKWIPFKKVDSMDNINNINKTQILLDSM